jgi:hypothetical protein
MKKDFTNEYFNIIKERAKKSRVYKKFQLTGLMIAQLLNDETHKSLYIKLAKTYDNDFLISLAKNIAEKKNIKNKGAYFMTMLTKAQKDRKVQHAKIRKNGK